MEVAPVIAYYEDKYLRDNNYCKGWGDEYCVYYNNCNGVKNVYYLKYQGIDKNIRFYMLKNNSDKDLLEEIADLYTKDKFKSLVFVDSKERGRNLKN